MKLKKYLSIFPIALISIGIAQAKGDIFYTAPFNKVEIKPASKIYVNYDFSPRTQTLICKSDPDNDAITSVEWSYKDAARKIELPVILKDKIGVAGHNSDPEGKLVITNEFGSSINDGSIFVTCEYRKIN